MDGMYIILIYFFLELLKIMDEVEYLVEVKVLMKFGVLKEVKGDGNGGKKEGNKVKNQKLLLVEGLVF